RPFFARHFPETPTRLGICTSWLLDPQLAEYLAPDSNVVRFGRRFTLVGDGYDGNAVVLRFVFHRITPQIDDLPQRTTLERAIVAIEAVERAGALERVGRELMDPVVLADVVDELGEPQDEPYEIELALRRQQRRVRAIGAHSALAGRPQDARDPRVRVLHVVDRILVRLLDRELEVEVELPVGARLQEEVTRRVLADGFDDLVEQQELVRAPLHPLE